MPNATDMILAVRRKYPNAALVTELTLDDDYARQAYFASLPASARAYYGAMVDPDFDGDATSQVPQVFYRRIDGLLLHNQAWSALEVKISRADFRRDTHEKRRAWMKHTHRFIYVTPQGLLTREEIPEGCGWWEVTNTGRVIVSKRARVNRERTEFPDSLVRTMFWRLHTASLRR